jgi:hypothetical protein
MKRNNKRAEAGQTKSDSKKALDGKKAGGGKAVKKGSRKR